jgi:hypothetical protein
MQEVLDVQNETTTPPTMDGSFTTMPGVLPLNAGDTITELNSDAGSFVGYRNTVTATNPYAGMNGTTITVNGTAAQGGSVGQSSNGVIKINNFLADANYIGNGGAITPPNNYMYNGAYQNGFLFNEAPGNAQFGGSFINIAPTTNQKNDPLYTYTFFTNTNKTGTTSSTVNPFLGDWSFTANGQLGLGGTGANVHFNSNSDAITFNDRIIFSSLATPTITSVVQGPGTGSLADGTYCYRLYERNNAGTGISSTEVCGAVANGGANTVQINLPRVAGSTIINLCGRTTGAELLLSPGPPIGSTVFIDDGSISPSGGSCTNTVDATRGFVDQAAKVGFNSQGATGPTTFETTVQATGSLGASNTVTLPATTGTLALNSAFVASGASHASGLVPDPGASAGTTRFLREDATWQLISLPTKYAPSLTPSAVTASTCAEQTFTVTGLATGQGILAADPTSAMSSHVWIGSKRASAANTLAIQFCADATGGTPPTGTWNVVAY